MSWITRRREGGKLSMYVFSFFVYLFEMADEFFCVDGEESSINATDIAVKSQLNPPSFRMILLRSS